MKQNNVMLMHPLHPNAMTQICDTFTVHRYDLADEKIEFLKRYGSDCTGIAINGHTRLSKDELEYFPNLEIVSCSSAGYEKIDTGELKKRNIALTNTSKALVDDVADLALLLTLATQRKLILAHNYVKTGAWGKDGMFPLLSCNKGKKVGIFGLGRIGVEIAKRLSPIGFEVAYYSRSQKSSSYKYFNSLEALAAYSDILIVVVPGGKETECVINKHILSRLGANGILINVARGSVVHEPHLIAALKDGTIAAAGLDVYWNEPNPDTELTSLNNVTLYPHHASGTEETRQAMSQLAVDNLIAHYQGCSLITPVKLK